MKHIPDTIMNVLKQKETALSRARKLFLSHPPSVFANNLTAWADIRHSVAQVLGVATHQVLVCGSAMVGYSFAKDRPFEQGNSDLDIAVISATLYIKCLEEANKVTRAYSDNTQFPRRDGISVLNSFLDTAAKRGMVHLKLMPKCIFKTDIERSLLRATKDYQSMFSEINCAVYGSEFLFVQKQASLVEIAETKI